MVSVPGLGKQSFGEAKGVQSGWAKCVDQTTDVGDGFLRLIQNSAQQSVSAPDIHCKKVPRRLRLHRQAGQLWSELVVKVTPQTPPLLLSRAHQSLPRPLQVSGEPHRLVTKACGVDGGPDLMREVLK